MIKIAATAILLNVSCIGVFEHSSAERPQPSFAFFKANSNDLCAKIVRIDCKSITYTNEDDDNLIITAGTCFLDVFIPASPGPRVFGEFSRFAGENNLRMAPSPFPDAVLSILCALNAYFLVMVPFNRQPLEMNIICGGFALVGQVIVPRQVQQVTAIINFALNTPDYRDPRSLLLTHDLIGFESSISGHYSSGVSFVGGSEGEQQDERGNYRYGCHDPLCERIARRNVVASPTPPPKSSVAIILAALAIWGLGCYFVLRKIAEPKD
ncbi:hypothetical protein [Roseisalinus antarcticus]|uniref:Uncharacterized protein n=1 Tax=Roseisalinus antarcticus TaxID=254357 RepID=A0A1Y5U125_9RHOB|nr:hypothetical protein [Roseisalinus antarcticus]SLN75935.1 hypothetical protein ROA7023_04064 [Roseisalinus antarcticus]